MLKKTLLTVILASVAFLGHAQRTTDKLDRGLVAMKSGTGVYLSWRIKGEEYYDVKYNVYRDGTKINEEPVSTSNFQDKSGNTSSKYTVSAIVRGVEQPQCSAASVWASSYKEVKLQHEGIASTLIPNDACCADVDGDGEIDILMKFDNLSEMEQSYPRNGPTVNGKVTGEYSIFEIFKQSGQRLWWVNCGPNMGDFQNNEQNIVGYDWDQDGKAEVVMRLLEGSTIHMADGKTYTIGANGQNGTSWNNYRGATGGGTNWFMHDGKEFLVYCNGETGEIYDIIAYPLARLEPGETSLEAAWGDGYGHRSNKFFFGAPYLDGRNPSIFLARGIYTQIKMCALDVNKVTHKLTKRWDWRQTAGGYWMWQGYHNFGVADVDEDGRDEIVYGSMVVDDNGKGLSTTGFGHGDAQHCGDFNPYTKGLEIYACNEDQPGNNYRDATTSKVYHRFNAGNDDGRAMMDNFTDNFPGSIGCSAREGAISSVTYGAISGMDATGINTNFRIYWDGDLCSETFNYLNGKNTEGCVAKYGSWAPIYTCAGSMTNNDTKGTPCYQGDILGDWREEIIMRTANNNIRIYSTPTATTYRIPTLWADHQYRNAMVWQMCGYNQPPHISYFLGKLEGITMAPPPYTMTGRDEIANGGTLDASYDGKHAILCETNDTKISLAEGAKPYIFTVNVPSWVQGTAGTNYTAKDAKINYKYYTCEVTGGSLAGDAMLVKQGDGILKLPSNEFSHTGATNVWAGTLEFDGKLPNSSLWMNRHTKLISNGGTFKSIKADYACTIIPGGDGETGNITTDSLTLGFGSRIKIDLNSKDITADCIKTKYLKIEKKTGTAWTLGGPQYLAPVIELTGHLAEGETTMAPGKYVIGEISGNISGAVSNIILEGLMTIKRTLYVEEGKLILEIEGMRDASTINWTAKNGSTWDLGDSENFAINGETTTFVSNDNVIFGDEAASKTVNIKGSVIPDTILVTGTSTYTIGGAGTIDGSAKFIMDGTGTVTMNGNNTYKGGNYLKGGITKVTLLANQYSEVGNLGGITGTGKFTMENGAVLQTTGSVRQGSPMKMIGTEGGIINNAGDFAMDAEFSGTLLTKKGAGWLKPSVRGTLSKLIVAAGTVESGVALASQIELQSTAALTGSGFLSTPLYIADKANAKLTTVNRATTSNTLTGSGKITVYCATEKGSNYYATRTPIQLKMTNFEGTIIPGATYTADGRFTFDTSSGSNKWTLDIPAGIIVQNSGSKILKIGKLTGTGTLGGTCAFSNGTSPAPNTWVVGNDADFTFDGIFTSNDKFEKVGAGKMTVSKEWTSSSTITVTEGKLLLKAGSSLGTGALTIAKNGYLTGTSSTKVFMTNSSTTVNGTLQPGTSETAISGSINFNGKNVTIGSTGKYIVGLRKGTITSTPSNTFITNIGNLKFTNGATISAYLYNGYVPTTDANTPDKFILWTEAKTATVGTVNYELPDLPAGNYWDTSEIADGILYVRYNPELAIESIDSNETVNVEVVAANGTVSESFECEMNDVDRNFQKANIAKGVYVLNIVSENGKNISVKKIKK